jgi:hypothetical protein
MSLGSRGQTALLCCAAAGCALLVGTAGGVLRFVAGLLLTTALPGGLAVTLVTTRFRGDRRLWNAALVVPLSLAVSALAGALIAVSGVGFRPATVASALLVCCLLVGAVALVRNRDGAKVSWRWPVVRPTAVLAAVPVLALTALLAVWVVAATHDRNAESYYTELAAESTTSILVHSHERATMRFRLETTVDGEWRDSAEFTLGPGESTRFSVAAGGGHARARLYVAGHSTPYRQITF